MRTVAAHLVALDAFPTSLWIDSINIDTAAAGADCADHADALLPFSTHASPATSGGSTTSLRAIDVAATPSTADMTADGAQMRLMSLSLSASESLDGDLFFLSDTMMFDELDDEAAWEIDGSVRSDGTDMEIVESVASDLDDQESADRSTVNVNFHHDNDNVVEDERDDDAAMERLVTRYAVVGQNKSKQQRHSVHFDRSWTLVEMSDMEVTVAHTEAADDSAAAAANVVDADVSAVAASPTAVKARVLDPIARVHQRKTKQRGYERNYRGRLRTQRCQFELTWLEREAELRKTLARKRALVLPPREDIAGDARARMLRKFTQLVHEERALKQEVVHLRVVDKWLEALSIWGVETEASRTIRYEVNTLPQLQAHPTFTDFAW
ncbi:hypothetical protein PybrP1_000526 [[Pythium] brassicae (nom. inval.)]|nr:hypothetical protein PybrP1_000526 [[Pythium] brassicae (nom. inval.)]